LSQLFQELKRRNVFRIGLAYLAVAWLVLQAADIVLDNINAPGWLMQALMFFMLIGFPVALVFAWAFELTPEGIKPEREVDRSESITHETGRKLNRTITAVLVAAVAFLLVDKLLLTDSKPDVAATEKSVAVLPFVAMSRGEDDEYFADGLTEEILNSLTRVPELLVTARTSAFYFKGKDVPIPVIAESLGVAHVVEGSVRRDGERLRVTAQLIRAHDGFHLWSENYDRNADDTFTVQTDIAEKIATALDVVLDEEQLARMQSVGLRDPEAYVAFQQGVEAYDSAHGSTYQEERLLVANAFFEIVLSLEPDSSLAYLYHSDYYAHSLLGSVINADISDEQRAEAFEKVNEDFNNAIRTAPDSAQRNSAAYDQALFSGRWRRLPAITNDILETPACVTPGWMDQTTLAYGQADKLLSSSLRLTQCDPLNFAGWSTTANAYLWLDDIDAAMETARIGKEATSHPAVRNAMTSALLAAGQIDDAEKIVEQEIVSEDALARFRLLLAMARGDRANTTLLLDELLETQPDLPEFHVQSLAQAGLRDEANALAARIDADPYGYLILMGVPGACMCGAPWDLEVTPNFAKLLEDAKLPWPPTSPINWPLKDW
jgi:TolB-like protein